MYKSTIPVTDIKVALCRGSPQEPPALVHLVVEGLVNPGLDGSATLADRVVPDDQDHQDQQADHQERGEGASVDLLAAIGARSDLGRDVDARDADRTAERCDDAAHDDDLLLELVGEPFHGSDLGESRPHVIPLLFGAVRPAVCATDRSYLY